LKGKLKLTYIIGTWVGKFDYIQNIGSQFYFKTNFKAPKGRIIMIDIANYDPNSPEKSLKEVIPEH